MPRGRAKGQHEGTAKGTHAGRDQMCAKGHHVSMDKQEHEMDERALCQRGLGRDQKRREVCAAIKIRSNQVVRCVP